METCVVTVFVVFSADDCLKKKLYCLRICTRKSSQNMMRQSSSTNCADTTQQLRPMERAMFSRLPASGWSTLSTNWMIWPRSAGSWGVKHTNDSIIRFFSNCELDSKFWFWTKKIEKFIPSNKFIVLGVFLKNVLLFGEN